MDKRDKASAWNEQGLSKFKGFNHIGRNYRQSGFFVKGLRVNCLRVNAAKNAQPIPTFSWPDTQIE